MAYTAARSTECGACSEEGLATWQGGTCSGQGKAQGDVGVHQCHHILLLPHIIAVITLSLQWWGHGSVAAAQADIFRKIVISCSIK